MSFEGQERSPITTFTRLVEPSLMPAFVVQWVGREEGPADLHVTSTGNHDPSWTDRTLYLLVVGRKPQSSPSQLMAMLIHWGGSPYVYLYTDIPVGGPPENYIATPVFGEGCCIVVMTPGF